MALYLPGTVPFVVYNTQDNTTSHYAHVRIGNDAAAYLQFIVDYYDCLPEHMAFIHAQQVDVETSKVTDTSAMHALGRLVQLADTWAARHALSTYL